LLTVTVTPVDVVVLRSVATAVNVWLVGHRRRVHVMP
jgi:hypothetical protein